MINFFLKILSHPGFKRYSINSLWIFCAEILRMLSGLFVGIWITRYLGPDNFGVFSYAVAFVSFFSGIAKLGLDSILVRDLILNKSQKFYFMGTGFWLKFIASFLVIAIILLAFQFTNTNHTTDLYILIISLGIFFQSFDVIDFYFQSLVLSKFVSLCKIFQIIFSAVLKIYLILIGADLFYFVIVALVDQFLMAAALAVAFYFHGKVNFIKYFDKKIATQLLYMSWPLMLSTLTVTIYMRIDQLMIGQMLGLESVGLFSAASRLSEIWYFIPLIIANSIFPAMIAAREIDITQYLHRLQILVTCLTWLAIGIAIPVSLFADSIVTILYGVSYENAGLVLSIHIWGGIFVFLGVASGSYFIVESYTRRPLYRTLFGAVSNILLNLLLIPYYGIVGSAIATVISQFIANFIIDFFDFKTRDLFFIKMRAFIPFYLLKKSK